MATMKREKKQPFTKLAKAAKTSPPASVSSTGEELFTDLLLLDEADNNAVINAVDGNVSATSTEVHVDDSERTSYTCLLYTSPSPRDGLLSRMPSSA